MERSSHSIKKQLYGQRGAVVIWFALLLPVLLGLAALAIDLARLGLAKAELQNAADAAALGGARSLSDPGGAPYNWAAATTAAELVARRNVANAEQIQDAQIETGYWNLQDPSLGFQPLPHTPVAGDVAAVRATVAISGTQNNGPLPFFFAPILGIDESDIEASAVAILPTAGGGTGFFPWVFRTCMIADYWDFDNNCALKDANGKPLVIDFNGSTVYHNGTCSGGTWTTFDDVANGANVVKQYIESRSTTNINIGDDTYIQPGDEESLYKKAKDENYVGKVVPILVVDNVVPKTFQTVVAIVALEITSIAKVKGHYHIKGNLSDNTYFGTLDPGSGSGLPMGAYTPSVLVK